MTYDNGPDCGHPRHSELVECTGCGARGSAFQDQFRTTLSKFEKDRIRERTNSPWWRPGPEIVRPIPRDRARELNLFIADMARIRT